MFTMRRLWLLLRGAGRELLVLLHALRDPATPLPIKAATVLLGLYLVSPVDAISDLLPVLGWADDVALLAIEGERDDISGLGQTKAALTLATSLPDEKKRYLMAEGAGHYGIFNGSRWRTKIAPVVEEWIAANG